MNGIANEPQQLVQLAVLVALIVVRLVVEEGYTIMIINVLFTSRMKINFTINACNPRLYPACGGY